RLARGDVVKRGVDMGEGMAVDVDVRVVPVPGVVPFRVLEILMNHELIEERVPPVRLHGIAQIDDTTHRTPHVSPPRSARVSRTDSARSDMCGHSMRRERPRARASAGEPSNARAAFMCATRAAAAFGADRSSSATSTFCQSAIASPPCPNSAIAVY